MIIQRTCVSCLSSYCNWFSEVDPLTTVSQVLNDRHDIDSVAIPIKTPPIVTHEMVEPPIENNRTATNGNELNTSTVQNPRKKRRKMTDEQTSNQIGKY